MTATTAQCSTDSWCRVPWVSPSLSTALAARHVDLSTLRTPAGFFEFAYVYIWIQGYMCTYIYVKTNIYTCICPLLSEVLCVYMYVLKYVYMHTYIDTLIYIYIPYVYFYICISIFRCIEAAINNPPAKGERVEIFNQIAETARVRDIAEMIQKQTGCEVRLQW